jgi:transposase
MKDSITKEKAITAEDYRTVAEALQISAATVKMIHLGYRKDRHFIAEAFEIIHNHKELSESQLKRKLARLKAKPFNRQAA